MKTTTIYSFTFFLTCKMCAHSRRMEKPSFDSFSLSFFSLLQKSPI